MCFISARNASALKMLPSRGVMAVTMREKNSFMKDTIYTYILIYPNQWYIL